MPERGLRQRRVESPLRRRGLRGGIVGVSVLALSLALVAGCDLQQQKPTQPLPGERLGLVTVYTQPPGLRVRLIGHTTADVLPMPPVPIEKGPDASPQWMSVSYQPGHNTVMEVQGFLADPPAIGQTVELSCDVEADGRKIQGAADIEYINEFNQQTAFVLCVFNENLVS